MTHRFFFKDCFCKIKAVFFKATQIKKTKERGYRRPYMRCRLSEIIKAGPHKTTCYKVPFHNCFPCITNRVSPVCRRIIIRCQEIFAVIFFIAASYRKRRCRFCCDHRHGRIFFMKGIINRKLVINACYINSDRCIFFF